MENDTCVPKRDDPTFCPSTNPPKFTMNLSVSWPPSFPGTIVSLRVLFITAYTHSYTSTALHNAWSPIIAALFAGNSVVLKCSEQVIWSTQWYVEAIRACLTACGHDPNIVQVWLVLPHYTHSAHTRSSWYAAIQTLPML